MSRQPAGNSGIGKTTQKEPNSVNNRVSALPGRSFSLESSEETPALTVPMVTVCRGRRNAVRGARTHRH